MQIDDPAAAPPPNPAAKDQVRSAGDDPARGDGPRARRRFRDALERGRHGSPGAEGTDDVASAASMAGWFRPEPAPAAAASAAGKAGTGAAAMAAARAVDRVLIGSGPDGAQARIRIGAGALAGTEIQLSGGAAGHAVEARLLTQAASSRQTLSVVMDEIRSRLRDRGIILSMRAASGRASPSASAFDASAGELTRPAAGATAGTRR